MLKKHKHDILAVLAVLGLLVSMYLTTSHYLGYIPPCTITHGCEAVLTSKYSILFGLPLSLWGIGFFFAVIVSCLLANHYKIWRTLLLVVLSVGGLASLVFLSLQFFVIKNICQYCLTADTLTILLLLLDVNMDFSDL